MNLKLKALRAQMNPHFTFNVMTSIQHFIINKDEESAIRYLSKFSKLMRAILNNSERNQIRIAEEIKVIELYLELEAMRFEDKFDYEILVDPAIDPENDEIPSMLIQPYIENAVKHGITPLKRRGRITVTISKSDDMIKCSIEDNGVGTAYKSQTEPEHQSFGSAITEERLAAMNALNNSRLSARITDLYDAAGEPCGTRVEIFIPLYIYDNDQRIDN
jgi:sensor histidine kinase YesM